MKTINLTLLALTCAFLAGCAGPARSISNSGFFGEEHTSYFAPRQNNSDRDFPYRGELSEFDVLGIERGQNASDQDIQHALDSAKAVTLNANSSILLIQSGAMFPDGPMVKELGKHFRVNTFSGVPNVMNFPPGRRNFQSETANRDPESFSQSLRLAAARGANDVILCYWGTLESAKENLATKDISWMPVLGWMVPDEKQHMRIRLKLALIDVRTGNWSVLSPDPFDDSRVSASIHRGAKDQKQVELLKNEAYEASVKDFVKRYLPAATASR